MNHALGRWRAPAVFVLDEPLRELKLMAERTAQTDSPLRGPRTVFGGEITALLQTLRAVLSGPDVDADRAHDRRQ